MKKNKFNTDKKSPLLRQAQHNAFGGVGEAFKILVIQQKMIGDVLTSSIICENLKRNFPNAEVHYLVNRFTIPVIENNPFIDQIIVFEDEYKQSKLRFYKFLKQISKAKYTHVFDAYCKLESLLISKFSRAKFKYGFRKSYSKFYYSKTVKMTNEVKTEAGSAIENRLRLLQLMGGIKILNDKPKIYLTKNEIEDATKQFNTLGLDPNNCVMISALGSGLNKSYPLPYLAKILDLVVEKTGKQLILNYMPSQQQSIDELLNLCAENTKAQVIEDMSMESLRDFIKVCSQCVAIIGNEGGSINMAKALNVPSFAIFSPWVTKEGWNSFEKSYHNDSVHLKDFEPEIYNKHSKKYKDRSLEMYQLLKPELFKDQLEAFLNELKEEV